MAWIRGSFGLGMQHFQRFWTLRGKIGKEQRSLEATCFADHGIGAQGVYGRPKRTLTNDLRDTGWDEIV